MDTKDEEAWLSVVAREEAQLEEEEAAATRTVELLTNRKRTRNSTADTEEQHEQRVIYPLWFQFSPSV